MADNHFPPGRAINKDRDACALVFCKLSEWRAISPITLLPLSRAEYVL